MPSRALALLIALVACNPPATPIVEVPIAPATPTRAELARAAYDANRTALEARRTELAARLDAERDVVLAEACKLVLDAITDELMPAWDGTRWAFYGTTTTPGKGTIACGYYVSTLLEHAGFEVERVKLAQQPSEHIVRTFTAKAQVRRFSNKPASDVIAEVERQGEGLYVLGLDYHAAMLWNDGETVRMCHSSTLGTGGAICEDALTSPAMESDYRVIGKLLDDRMVEAWLRGLAFPTYL